MNRKSTMLIGALSGTVWGLLIGRTLSKRNRIAKRSQQLETAINTQLYHDKKDLEQSRDILEAQLQILNEQIEKLS
ncbi:MAG: hypothetical protein ACTHJ0_06160 [Flavipsychrobacter sp.]